MEEVLSPREHGLRLGREYAMRAVDDRAKLRRVVRGKNAEEVRAGIDWTLLEALDRERPVEFWSGFAHGVREFLVEQAAAQSGASTPSQPDSASP